jgi:peptide/nickel transport system substrate-binding protein
MLATRWSADPQAKVWTFNLRQGVKFHHGREMKASDVAFTIERILDPKTASPGRTALGPIEKVEAVDDYTVRFRMSSPYADLPVNLGVTFGRILPADRADKIVSEPSGTGPFRVVEFKPGEHTRLVKFADYWDKPKPHLDELWQVNMPQHATQVASLSGGDVQMMFEVPVSLIGSLERTPGVSLVSVKSTSFQPLVLATDHKPFDDNRVRMAMKLLLDREAIIKAVWQGRGTAGNDHPVPEINPFYAVRTQRTPDVARAKALLAEAGYPNGLETTLSFDLGNATVYEPAAVLVQEALAGIGIKTTLNKIPPANWRTALAKKDMPLFINQFGGWLNYPEYFFLWTYHGQNSLFNTSSYQNPEMDKLIEAAHRESDAKKYAETVQAFTRIALADVPKIPLMQPTQDVAMQKNVTGYQYWFHRQLDFRTLVKQ